jgi:hypothetical protein
MKVSQFEAWSGNRSTGVKGKKSQEGKPRSNSGRTNRTEPLGCEKKHMVGSSRRLGGTGPELSY